MNLIDVMQDSKQRWLMLIQDVPRDIALGEFDCRKTRCISVEWEHCMRRWSKL